MQAMENGFVFSFDEFFSSIFEYLEGSTVDKRMQCFIFPIFAVKVDDNSESIANLIIWADVQDIAENYCFKIDIFRVLLFFHYIKIFTDDTCKFFQIHIADVFVFVLENAFLIVFQ